MKKHDKQQTYVERYYNNAGDECYRLHIKEDTISDKIKYRHRNSYYWNPRHKKEVIGFIVFLVVLIFSIYMQFHGIQIGNKIYYFHWL